ncbi:hypothetical protein BBJ29_002545 [Phytophthora kernoviae]|uniref:Uncharacterized protein n=1 Tax=Phytophthora kernoviae TaxID=325452 RepID=A0A3F2RYY0_9STRA|nr:hypothetical protein BBJ29_002545 [Phytophthora kernoviae]RLN67001.1 hypothetical protein BBP00_00001898 [Phytophthora kernoviae]
MGRRQREESDVGNIEAQGREHNNKHMKRTRGAHGGWGAFLEKLHSCLENGTEEDSFSWVGDGSQFAIMQTHEPRIEALLGLRVCSVHQALEVLGFECTQELYSEYSIYRHRSFVRGNPGTIGQILAHSMLPSSNEKDLTMPRVAYSSELNPLEVRVIPRDLHSQAWEVTIAPSILPHLAIDKGVGGGDSVAAMWHFAEITRDESNRETCREGILMDTDRWGSDTEMESPLWWSQRSDFSSICTDDLSDMDTLSQISTYYA